MALRNAFGNLALDTTVANVYSWLQARLGAKTTANSISVSIASDQTVPISGTVTATGPLTDTQLRATAVPVSGPLTDTELRSTAVSVAPNITRGSGIADANTQRVTLASDGPAVTALTSIDGKIPALVSGRQPVDGSGVTQPISATALPLPNGASTSALQTTGNTSLSSIDSKLPALTSGSVPVLVQNGQLEIQNDSGNPIPVGPAATQALSGSASALNADLFSVDCSAYRSINFQITGTWVGTISFQVSNDNTNWSNFALTPAAGSTATSTTTGLNGIFLGTLGGFNFIRLRFTAYTSGTATVAGFLLREPINAPLNTTNITISNIQTTTTTASSTTPYTVNSAASTNAASIKASGANLYGMSIMNASASTKYVRFFNKASAPTVGTDVPIMVVAVPATSSKEIEYIPAMRFVTGLAVAITGGAAATDSTAVAAGDVQLMVSYA